MSAAERQRRYRAKHPEKARALLYAWRERNKEKFLDTTRRYRAVRQHIIRAAKNMPCMDCLQEYPPCVMDLDHVRGKKLKNVALMTTAPVDVLRAEIAKCDVVCANCHRLRTQSRRKQPCP